MKEIIQHFEIDKLPMALIIRIFGFLDTKSFLKMCTVSKTCNSFISTHMMDHLTVYINCEPKLTPDEKMDLSRRIRHLIKSKRQYQNFVIKNFGEASLNFKPNVKNIVNQFKNHIKSVKFFDARDSSPNSLVRLIPNLKELDVFCLSEQNVLESDISLNKINVNLHKIENEPIFCKFMETQKALKEAKFIVRDGISSKILEEIVKRKTLKRLHLKHSNKNFKLICNFKSILINRTLEVLTLEDPGLESFGTTDLLKILPNLKSLKVNLSKGAINLDLIRQINSLKYLECVKINHNLPIACFRIIKCRSMSSVQFCLDSMTDVNMRSWRSFLKANSHLKALKISNCSSNIKMEQIIEILKLLPCLEHFELNSIYGQNLGEEIVQDICSEGSSLKVLKIMYYGERCSWFDFGNIQNFPDVNIEVRRFVKYAKVSNGSAGPDPILFWCSGV